MTNRAIWPGSQPSDPVRIWKVLPPDACGPARHIPESASHGGRGDRVVAGFLGGVARRPSHGRRVSQAVIDSAAWAGALVLCSVLRLGSGGLESWRLIPLVPLVVIAQLAAGSFFGLYRGKWVFGSVEEVGAVAKSFFVAGVGLLIVDGSIMYDRPLPISAVLAGGTMAVLVMVAVRFWWRMDHDRQLRRTLKDRGCQRVIVFGAGSGGRSAIAAMFNDAESAYFPVALLDDDPGMRGVTTRGVKVVGDRNDMQRVAAEHHASAVVIAVPERVELGRSRTVGAGNQSRAPGTSAPVGARAARRPRTRRRHPRTQRARPDRSPLDRDRPRPGRLVPAQQAGPRHRGRRLDRFRAVPPDRRSSARPS